MTTTTGAGPQPITYPSPGFWPQVAGPESDASNGDAYSPRCYGGNVCGSPPPPTTPTARAGTRTPSRCRPPTCRRASTSRCSTRASTPGPVRAGRDRRRRSTSAPQPPSNFTTEYQLYNTDGTPLDPTDNPAMTAPVRGRLRGSDPRTPATGGWRAAASGDVREHLGDPLPHRRPRLRAGSTTSGSSTDHAIDGTTAGAGIEPLRPAGAQQLRLGGLDRALRGRVPVRQLPHRLRDLRAGQRQPAVRRADPRPEPVGPGRRRRGSQRHGDRAAAHGNGLVHLGQQLRRGVHVATVRQRLRGNREGSCRARRARSRRAPSPRARRAPAHFNGDWLQVRVAIPPDYTCDPTTPSTASGPSGTTGPRRATPTARPGRRPRSSDRSRAARGAGGHCEPSTSHEARPIRLAPRGVTGDTPDPAYNPAVVAPRDLRCAVLL